MTWESPWMLVGWALAPWAAWLAHRPVRTRVVRVVDLAPWRAAAAHRPLRPRRRRVDPLLAALIPGLAATALAGPGFSSTDTYGTVHVVVDGASSMGLRDFSVVSAAQIFRDDIPSLSASVAVAPTSTDGNGADAPPPPRLPPTNGIVPTPTVARTRWERASDYVTAWTRRYPDVRFRVTVAGHPDALPPGESARDTSSAQPFVSWAWTQAQRTGPVPDGASVERAYGPIDHASTFTERDAIHALRAALDMAARDGGGVVWVSDRPSPVVDERVATVRVDGVGGNPAWLSARLEGTAAQPCLFATAAWLCSAPGPAACGGADGDLGFGTATPDGSVRESGGNLAAEGTFHELPLLSPSARKGEVREIDLSPRGAAWGGRGRSDTETSVAARPFGVTWRPATPPPSTRATQDASRNAPSANGADAGDVAPTHRAWCLWMRPGEFRALSLPLPFVDTLYGGTLRLQPWPVGHAAPPSPPDASPVPLSPDSPAARALHAAVVPFPAGRDDDDVAFVPPLGQRTFRIAPRLNERTHGRLALALRHVAGWTPRPWHDPSARLVLDDDFAALDHPPPGGVHALWLVAPEGAGARLAPASRPLDGEAVTARAPGTGTVTPSFSAPSSVSSSGTSRDNGKRTFPVRSGGADDSRGPAVALDYTFFDAPDASPPLPRALPEGTVESAGRLRFRPPVWRDPHDPLARGSVHVWAELLTTDGARVPWMFTARTDRSRPPPPANPSGVRSFGAPPVDGSSMAHRPLPSLLPSPISPATSTPGRDGGWTVFGYWAALPDAWTRHAAFAVCAAEFADALGPPAEARLPGLAASHPRAARPPSDPSDPSGLSMGLPLLPPAAFKSPPRSGSHPDRTDTPSPIARRLLLLMAAGVAWGLAARVFRRQALSSGFVERTAAQTGKQDRGAVSKAP